MPISLVDIDFATVLTVLDSLPDAFRTKDVSEPVAQMEVHASLGSQPQYHAVLGRYLRKHGPSLGLRLVSAAAHPRGALWQRVPAVEEHRPAVASGTTQPVRAGHELSLRY